MEFLNQNSNSFELSVWLSISIVAVFLLKIMYSTEEKIEIIKWYYSGNSARRVSDMFAVQYPDRPIPQPTTIQRIIIRFEKTGTLINYCKCSNGQVDVRNDRNDNVLSVLAAVTENPHVSIRQIANQYDMHHSTAQKI